uniref:hypothetical protein n=1 Tax=Cupriavidus gilardii TaxID=82541 RepID=UPI00247979B9|nr:hypothetical protein [Cupriavidus gilardii]
MDLNAHKSPFGARMYDRLQRRAEKITSALENPFRLTAEQAWNLQSELRGIRRRQHTLLAKLADAPDVPERIKVNIAKELQRDGSITFGFLLDLEEQRAKETWRKQQEAGTGFQKMLAIVESMGVSKSAWSCHAYPLQRITIQLQGTRHSERNSIIAQLDTIKARLLAGDINGTEHDDDFGYSFEVQTQAHGPSIFDEPCGV